MCFTRIINYRCGHSINPGGFCDRVAAFPASQKKDNCDNSITTNDHVDQSCGSAGYYCKHDADGARLERVYNDITQHELLQNHFTTQIEALQEKRTTLANNLAGAGSSQANTRADDVGLLQDPVVRLDAHIARVAHQKEDNAWTIRQLKRKVTAGEHHFHIALPTAIAQGRPLPALIFPPDETRPHVAPASAPAQTPRQPGLPASSLSAFPLIASLPIDPATGDRSGSVASLLADNIAAIHAKYNESIEGAHANPRTPVKAKRKMKQTIGPSNRPAAFKSFTPKVKSPGAVNSNIGVPTIRGTAANLTDEQSGTSTRRPKRKIAMVDYSEVPTEDSNAGTYPAYAAGQESGDTLAGGRRKIVKLKTLPRESVSQGTYYSTPALQTYASSYGSTVQSNNLASPYTDMSVYSIDPSALTTPSASGFHSGLDVQPALLNDHLLRLQASDLQLHNDQTQYYDQAASLNLGPLLGETAPNASHELKYAPAAGELYQYLQTPIVSAAAGTPRTSISTVSQFDQIPTPAFAGSQLHAHGSSTTSFHQSAQLPFGADYQSYDNSWTDNGYDGMLLPSLPGHYNSPDQGFGQPTTSPPTSSSSTTQEFTMQAGQVLDDFGGTGSKAEHQALEDTGPGLAGSPGPASVFSSNSFMQAPPHSSNDAADATAMSFDPLDDLDIDLFKNDDFFKNIFV